MEQFPSLASITLFNPNVSRTYKKFCDLCTWPESGKTDLKKLASVKEQIFSFQVPIVQLLILNLRRDFVDMLCKCTVVNVYWSCLAYIKQSINFYLYRVKSQPKASQSPLHNLEETNWCIYHWMLLKWYLPHLYCTVVLNNAPSDNLGRPLTSWTEPPTSITTSCFIFAHSLLLSCGACEELFGCELWVPWKALYETKTLLLICEGGGLCFFIELYMWLWLFKCLAIVPQKNVVKDVIEISRK